MFDAQDSISTPAGEVTIPAEAWPYIEILFNITCAMAAIWLATTVFVIWRRKASNLTPVNAADKNHKAEPDFLSVDHKAREEAIKRGEGFEQELERREREAEKHNKSTLSKGLFAQRISGLVALITALFSIASIIVGSIFTVKRFGKTLEDVSSFEHVVTAIQAHPIVITVSVLVILVRIYTFLKSRNQEA